MKKNHSFRSWRPLICAALIFTVARTIWPESAPAQSVTKDVVLRNIVRDVILPGYQELALKCRALTGSVEALAKAPAQGALEQARQAWIAALLASRQIQWLQTGPVADREYLATFYYAKVLPLRIEEVLISSRVIDDAYLAEVGATAKGMFALEYLLFGRKTEAAAGGKSATAAVLEMFSSPASPRRGALVLALAHDLETKAGQLVVDWSASGDQGAAAKFTAAGQASLNRVVNQLAQLIEQVAEQRIHFVLQLPNPIARQLSRIEGSPSGTSQQTSVALVQGIQKMYRGVDGGGLEGYVKHLNAPLAERLKRELETVITAIQAIGAPLEQAVPSDRAPVQNAYEKTHAFEVLCKADLASALGVTLTFNSGDGD